MFTEDALKKLVVAQLKAICKERLLTGVSKLTKALLIQKILDHQRNQSDAAPTAQNVPTQPSKAPSALARDVSGQQAAPTTQNAPSQPSKAPALARDVSVLSGPSLLTQQSQPFQPSHSQSSQTQPPKADLPQRLPTKVLSISKASDAPQVLNSSSIPAKETPDANASRLSTEPLTKKRPAPKESDQKSKKPKPIPFLFPPKATKENVRNQPDAKAPTLTGTGKRFTPLIVKKPAPAPTPPKATLTDAYLDFPDLPPISLHTITLPPTMAQRRLVTRIALILSQVHEADLKPCTLVSRMFRYAIYLSASARIQREFPGRRLAPLLDAYPQSMTNMWPYLRLRRQEAAHRREAYDASFLPRALGTVSPIAPRLWASPDHEHQTKIAVRFLLTRLFFSVSVGGDWAAEGTVVDVQEVVRGEIWCVTLEGGETFYVLEATCEVIDGGRPDWAAYIQSRHGSLMERVCWTNHEEYDRGISRHWLKRIRREGPALEAIAARYVLACVVSNSVSGEWMSASEMAHDSGVRPIQKKIKERVNLFLPAHHHVESVHVGGPLHPALAVVQTPGREYFVLRDNGMQVGCEGEGVARVWMGLLGCDARGRVG